MHKFKLIVAISLLLTSFVALASSEDLPVYTDAKPAVMVAAHQPQFVIKLKSNPTTGYSWFLRDYDATRIQAVKHVFVASEDKKLVGASGHQLWTFRVKPSAFVVPQQMMIRFAYARPWEAADNTTQVVFSVTTSEK